ncbi:hypothetical protein WH8501_07825 [Crocosphaera watsonii WH 8501]|uniref:Uncharacterized protein n=5 Tax=Crocosphaera watsonii TaxID=263511 RepID=Q4BZB1_CROWT|nr:MULTISPECIES: hypothetical protein [Crocosphaera]EAM49232.1 hypothetical protein CwatDRAFT_1937 [Crocosphaera watsonii WH 8501]EHJ13200.1 hypothetical protein CWATWH0003_2137 [Crocosphaera watsonii WH 0003]MCH2243666.1 hypothetical protein [Crocosphaera sp.]NQZ62890.1 hypothetical protein [Crocosphaera sp.]CCQ50860.1 FIG00557105: hypothetical protein [Crocosphaera watsonii WH 8502]
MDDRKKRILEHLKQSGDGTAYISPKKTSQQTPAPEPTPEKTPEPTPETTSEQKTSPEPLPVSKPMVKDDRKQKIMAHVKSSSANFGKFSLEDDSKKKKIEEHIRKSLS